jgi:hypothetical protein
VIGSVPHQNRLPEVHVTEVGIARAGGGAGTGGGTGLSGRWKNLPRLVDDLGGAVTGTWDSLKYQIDVPISGPFSVVIVGEWRAKVPHRLYLFKPRRLLSLCRYLPRRG